MSQSQNTALVMVVDDDWLNRELMQGVLEYNGHQMLLATNGKQALKLVEENKPDLILVDVLMPDMTGYEVCSRLRQQPNGKATRIVMMSGLQGTETERQQALDAGADDFINRSMTTAALSEYISTMLQDK